jgi:hypothetical protein
MVKRSAPLGVVSFVLMAACGAVCQSVSQPLPDAPSVQAAIQAQKFNGFAEPARSPFAMGGHAGVMRQAGSATADKAVYSQQESSLLPSNTILGRYLYPSLLRQQSGYHTSNGGSLMGRATYAASRIFVTRDDSGKGRLNTSYFLRALTSVAADTASRPYWRRSVGAPFSAFGSTVGNEAGINLLHEFRPGIQQLMKSHAPKFVARIAESIGHN